MSCWLPRRSSCRGWRCRSHETRHDPACVGSCAGGHLLKHATRRRRGELGTACDLLGVAEVDAALAAPVVVHAKAVAVGGAGSFGGGQAGVTGLGCQALAVAVLLGVLGEFFRPPTSAWQLHDRFGASGELASANCSRDGRHWRGVSHHGAANQAAKQPQQHGALAGGGSVHDYTVVLSGRWALCRAVWAVTEYEVCVRVVGC